MSISMFSVISLWLFVSLHNGLLQAQPECTWTKFYNRDSPSGTGDWEHLSALRNENQGQICEKPVDVEAQLIDGRPHTAGGDTITLSPSVGLICKNIQQSGDNRCADYKVRFCCPKAQPECTWTKFYNRDSPSGSGDWEVLANLRNENRGQICEKPDDVEAQLIDGRPHTAGGDVLTLSPSVGLVCRNDRQTGGNRCDDYKVRFCCPKAQPECTWTKFYDRDNPSGSGDWEDLSALRNENLGQICEKPVDVEAQLIDGRPHTAGGDVLTLSPTVGLVCRNDRQSGGNRCDDYKVRFCCPASTVVPKVRSLSSGFLRSLKKILNL